MRYRLKTDNDRLNSLNDSFVLDYKLTEFNKKNVKLESVEHFHLI